MSKRAIYNNRGASDESLRRREMRLKCETRGARALEMPRRASTVSSSSDWTMEMGVPSPGSAVHLSVARSETGAQV